MTIYNGIEFDRYSSGQRIAIPGITPEAVTILCVTALNFENKSKGLTLVLDAFERVLASRKNVKLVIAAKSASQRYTHEAEATLHARPSRDSVILLFNRRDVPDLLASGDIFVYATPANSNDSLPRALLEAQCAGLPVVTTNTTGCPKIVLDGKTGFVASYDAAVMAERIVQLVDDSGLRGRLGHNAQEWVRRRFSWRQMACAYAKIFLEIADAQGIPR
jgi:glycosyltransferase involved in cell wall biosynthesis